MVVAFLLGSLLRRHFILSLLYFLVDLKVPPLAEELPLTNLCHLPLVVVCGSLGEPRHLRHTIDLVVEDAA